MKKFIVKAVCSDSNVSDSRDEIVALLGGFLPDNDRASRGKGGAGEFAFIFNTWGEQSARDLEAILAGAKCVIRVDVELAYPPARRSGLPSASETWALQDEAREHGSEE